MSVFARHGIAALGVVAALVLAGGLAPADAQAPATADLPTQVNSCWTSDNGNPVVDSITLSPSTVDTSDGPVRVHMRVTAHDTGGPGPATGVRDVRVFDAIRADPQAGVPQPKAFKPTLTQVSGGTWSGSFVVPQGISASFGVTVAASDRAAHITYAGMDEHLQVSTAKRDTKAPALRSVTISRRQVDTRKHPEILVMDVRATDALSGISYVKTTTGYYHRLRHLRGDVYRLTTRIPRHSGNATHRFGLMVEDLAGNDTYLSPAKLRDRGLPSSFTVRSQPPIHYTDQDETVRVLHIDHRVDVRQKSGWTRIRIAASSHQPVTRVAARLDARSGVPGPFPTARLHRVSGTARHGVWAGRLRVPRCTIHDDSTYVYINASNVGTARRITILSHDHEPPELTRKPVRSSDDPRTLSVRFTEPVHGISSDSVAVGPSLAETSAATWTCFDAHGASTSCLDGTVWSAQVTTDPADPEPQVIQWSPEHHLGVLDRNGNPLMGISDQIREPSPPSS